MLLRFLELLLLEIITAPCDKIHHLKKKVKKEGMDCEKYEEIIKKCGKKNILIELLRHLKRGEHQCYKEKLCKFILHHAKYFEESENLNIQNPNINNDVYIAVMIAMNNSRTLSKAIIDVIEKISCKKPNQILLLKLLNSRDEVNSMTIQLLLDLNNLSWKVLDRVDRVLKGEGNPADELLMFLRDEALPFISESVEGIIDFLDDCTNKDNRERNNRDNRDNRGDRDNRDEGEEREDGLEEKNSEEHESDFNRKNDDSEHYNNITIQHWTEARKENESKQDNITLDKIIEKYT